MVDGSFRWVLSCVVLGAAMVAAGEQPSALEERAAGPADAGGADGMVRVDVGHVVNAIDPDVATGAWMDDLSKNQVDNLSKPEVILGVMNLGWGSITMRNNSELRLSAWHWNESGGWSDAEHKSGYFAGSAELGEAIKYGYSYSLPHRDFMTSGDPPLVEGCRVIGRAIRI